MSDAWWVDLWEDLKDPEYRKVFEETLKELEDEQST